MHTRDTTAAPQGQWATRPGASARGLALGMAAGALLLGLAAASGPADAQIRCWTNEGGSRECSDLPPPAGARGVSEVRGRAGRIEGQDSFAQRQASERFPVTLWSNDCGDPCTAARKLLASRGVPYTDRNPAQPALQEEFKRITRGQMQVPLLIVGTSTLVGFEEGQWNTTLDAAGYGRTAAPGRRPGAAAPATAQQPRGAQPQPSGSGGPQPAPGAPGQGQPGPGGVVVPPQPAASGAAPLPETSGGPGTPGVQTFSSAGPAGSPGLPR
jgi:hypothetical protein